MDPNHYTSQTTSPIPWRISQHRAFAPINVALRIVRDRDRYIRRLFSLPPTRCQPTTTMADTTNSDTNSDPRYLQTTSTSTTVTENIIQHQVPLPTEISLYIFPSIQIFPFSLIAPTLNPRNSSHPSLPARAQRQASRESSDILTTSSTTEINIHTPAQSQHISVSHTSTTQYQHQHQAPAGPEPIVINITNEDISRFYRKLTKPFDCILPSGNGFLRSFLEGAIAGVVIAWGVVVPVGCCCGLVVWLR